MENLLKQLGGMPLNEMGPIFDVLAGRVYEHRLTNNGRVPTPLFLPCVSLSGLSVSFQVDNDVVDRCGRHIGFAMKFREIDREIDHHGQFHNTCCVGTMMDTATSGFDRNTKETLGVVPPDEELEVLGVTVHSQPIRRSACLTVMKRRKVTMAEVAGFIGTWWVFSDEEIRTYPDKIVLADCYRLEWVMDPDRPLIADIRGGWWPGKHLGAPRPTSPA